MTLVVIILEYFTDSELTVKNLFDFMSSLSSRGSC